MIFSNAERYDLKAVPTAYGESRLFIELPCRGRTFLRIYCSGLSTHSFWRD